ncbi:MAG: serine/threonine-protein kinase [Verrucomicrobiota bacterium]
MSSGSNSRLALPTGTKLDRFEIQSVLGAGGFGITYCAYDPALKRYLAIKELFPSDIALRLDGIRVGAREPAYNEELKWARERFITEGRILAECDHKAVMGVYDTFDLNGTAYLLMPYLQGRTLSEWKDEIGERPGLSELCVLSRHVLSGLRAVHRKSFLHRDIKPDNIYLTDDGQPILIDFGAARLAISSRSQPITSIVTPGYAPFEQYYSESETDGTQGPWTDLYSFGAVLWWAIVGKKPLAATRRTQIDIGLLADTPELVKVYGAKFLRGVDRALFMEQTARPQTADEMYWDLLGKTLP